MGNRIIPFSLMSTNVQKNRLTDSSSDFLLKGIINTGGNGNPAAGRIGRKLVHQGITAEHSVPRTAPGLC